MSSFDCFYRGSIAVFKLFGGVTLNYSMYKILDLHPLTNYNAFNWFNAV